MPEELRFSRHARAFSFYGTLNRRNSSVDLGLVPDAVVPAVADAVVRDLAAASSGKLIDLSVMAGSRFLGAIAAIAGLAERLDRNQADHVLAFFEAQPAVGENQYRYHDDDEALAVAGILVTHPELANRALVHLVSLLGRSYTSRKSRAHDAVTARMDEARPLLVTLAGEGNSWAREVLATESPNEVNAADVQQARLRLEAPLETVPGVTTVGSGAHSLSDSILVRTLPPARQQASLRQLLVKAADLHVDALDRSSYLLAASNLEPPRTRAVRSELFEQALMLVLTPPQYLTDASDAEFAHPLGSFRITGKTDSRAEAAYVAAGLAQTMHDKDRVRSAILSLMGDDGASEYWATRAMPRQGTR